MNKLQQIGQMRKMMALKKKLAKQKIVVEEGNARVVINGEMKVKEIQIDGEDQRDAAEAVNKAFKKSQELAAPSMQEILKGMGLG